MTAYHCRFSGRACPEPSFLGGGNTTVTLAALVAAPDMGLRCAGCELGVGLATSGGHGATTTAHHRCGTWHAALLMLRSPPERLVTGMVIACSSA